MLRYFLVLAVTDGSLLLATFVLGLLATGEPRGPHDVLRGVHVLVALATVMATLAVHSIAYTYFLATGKWAAEVVRVYELPEWINHQAKKNKRKAFRFEFWGMTTVAIAAWLGGGADTMGVDPLWHLAASAVAVGFNLGAFAVIYPVIVAQHRLLGEVKTQADRLREARHAEILATSGQESEQEPASPV
ncbi:MAG: hypothetical protein U0835_01600 [Isosphaeraceae bacterium]